MVAPVTGPYFRTSLVPGASPAGSQYYTSIKTQKWFKQSRPYNLNLEYIMDLKRISSHVDPQGNNYADASVAPAFSGSRYDETYALAYNKFRDSVGEAAQWAVNLHERRQAMSSLTDGLSTLLKFTRQVNRFDFLGAARTLRTSVPKGLRRTSKSLGSNWLRWHLGIKPLLKDIHAAAEILDQIPRPHRVKAKARTRQNGSFSTGTFGHFDSWFEETNVVIMADVAVKDPDSYRANKLGFVNPASFVWETIPFSFVVDWFVNVSDYLGSFTDFVGLDITNPMHTVYQSWEYSLTWYFGLATGYESAYIRRTLSIPGPVLHVRPWKAISPTRAATAVSLLLQQLKR